MCLGNKVVSEPSVVFYFLVWAVGWEADCMFIFYRIRYVYAVTCGSGTWVVKYGEVFCTPDPHLILAADLRHKHPCWPRDSLACAAAENRLPGQPHFPTPLRPGAAEVRPTECSWTRVHTPP